MDELLGKRFSDPEGEWEVTNIDGDYADVKNTRDGKTFNVPLCEAVYYLYGGDDEFMDTAKSIIGNGLYAQAVEFMDDELREQIHTALAPCSDETFLAVYLANHKHSFKEDLQLP